MVNWGVLGTVRLYVSLLKILYSRSTIWEGHCTVMNASSPRWEARKGKIRDQHFDKMFRFRSGRVAASVRRHTYYLRGLCISVHIPNNRRLLLQLGSSSWPQAWGSLYTYISILLGFFALFLYTSLSAHSIYTVYLDKATPTSNVWTFWDVLIWCCFFFFHFWTYIKSE